MKKTMGGKLWKQKSDKKLQMKENIGKIIYNQERSDQEKMQEERNIA